MQFRGTYPSVETLCAIGNEEDLHSAIKDENTGQNDVEQQDIMVSSPIGQELVGERPSKVR